jgi:hypothetical protein
MSRGLGVWQKRIIEALTTRHGLTGPVQVRDQPVIGGDYVPCDNDKGFWLEAGWHDMRQVSAELIKRSHSRRYTEAERWPLFMELTATKDDARRDEIKAELRELTAMDRKCEGFNNTQEAAFSRAARLLAKRGLIETWCFVPLYLDETGKAMHLADGLLLGARQYRFCTLAGWRDREREQPVKWPGRWKRWDRKSMKPVHLDAAEPWGRWTPSKVEVDPEYDAIAEWNRALHG